MKSCFKKKVFCCANYSTPSFSLSTAKMLAVAVLVLAATLVVQLPDRKGRATVVEPIE